MKFLSELDIKVYDVTKDGELREWMLDINTMTFKTIGREYSANHMGTDAVVVKVSNIKDINNNKIEEGQTISDKDNNSYIVIFKDGCFKAVNISSKEEMLLKDIKLPKIVKKYPEEVSNLLAEAIKDAGTSKTYTGIYALTFFFSEDKLAKEAQAKNIGITSLRKKYLKTIDWEVCILSDKQINSNVAGVYLKGRYTIDDVNLNVSHEEIEDVFRYLNELIPPLETIKLTPKG